MKNNIKVELKDRFTGEKTGEIILSSKFHNENDLSYDYLGIEDIRSDDSIIKFGSYSEMEVEYKTKTKKTHNEWKKFIKSCDYKRSEFDKKIGAEITK